MSLNQSDTILTLSKSYCHELKKLHQKKFRKIERKTLVEGFNLIEQLFSNGIIPAEIVSNNQTLIPGFLEGKCKIWIAKEPEYQYLADTETPQPIMAVYSLPEYGIEDYKALLYLDGIQDPGNLGTIFRVAAAFNFDGIVLSSECCDAFSPKVIRASLGSVFWIPSIIADKDWLSNQSAIKIGLDSHSKISIDDVNINRESSVILIIGSESKGINKTIQSALTYEVAIPIYRKMESINASVATGIAAYVVSKKLFLLT